MFFAFHWILQKAHYFVMFFVRMDEPETNSMTFPPPFRVFVLGRCAPSRMGKSPRNGKKAPGFPQFRRKPGTLAHQRGLEPPTYRLGGGRSIQLSYWCIRSVILPKFFLSVKKIRHFFCFGKHILSGSVFRRKVKPCTSVTIPAPIWMI